MLNGVNFTLRIKLPSKFKKKKTSVSIPLLNLRIGLGFCVQISKNHYRCTLNEICLIISLYRLGVFNKHLTTVRHKNVPKNKIYKVLNFPLKIFNNVLIWFSILFIMILHVCRLITLLKLTYFMLGFPSNQIAIHSSQGQQIKDSFTENHK